MAMHMLKAKKTQEIALNGSASNYGLCAKLMSDKDLVIHYTRRNVEREEALHSAHAYIWKYCLCNGSRREEGQA
jgi:hypothetical protein